MKKRREALIQLVILGALGLAVILTTVLPQRPAGRMVTVPMEISVVIRETDSSFWSNVRLGMEQAAGELGAELRFLTLGEVNDGEGQLQLLRREAEQGADAVVVVPADPESLSAALAEQALGCPLICMESPVAAAAPAVAVDDAALGRELAMAVLEDWRGGSILLVNRAAESSGVSVRMEAARQTLVQAGVRLELSTEAPEEGGDLRTQLAETGAAGVVVFEAALTEQAAGLKETLGLGFSLYGVGMTASIAAGLERGTVSAAAVWSDFAAGYLAVAAAAGQVRGETYPMEQLPFYVVRGDDLYDQEYQKLLFPVTP